MHPQFRVLQFVWLILGLSQLILLIPAIWIYRKGLPGPEGSSQGLIMICILFLVMSAAVPFLWYRSRKKQIDRNWDEERKLTHYRAPLYFGWVLCEGANMVTLIAFMITRQEIFLWIFAAGFALYFFQKPNWTVFSRDYQVISS